MANSGGKSPTSTSQFFIVMAKEDKLLAKLKGIEDWCPVSIRLADRLVGKYVVFGKIVEGESVLDLLDEIGAALGDKDESPKAPVWIGDCGVV